MYTNLYSYWHIEIENKNAVNKHYMQVLNEDFETGCPKLAIVKSLGTLLFKGDHRPQR